MHNAFDSSHNYNKIQRWPLHEFAILPDTMKTNSKIILSNNKVKLINFAFTYELGNSLVLACIQRMYENNNDIQGTTL